MQIQSNVACRLRLYATQGAQASDALRPASQPLFASMQSQCICDLVLNATTGFTWVLAPEAIGSDLSVSPSGNIYYNLTNLNNTTETVAVTLTYLPMET